MNDNWKTALLRLRDIYSDNQLAVMLGLSHGAVAGRLMKFDESDYASRILQILSDIEAGQDPRLILFKSWSDRYVSNINALVIRKLRELYKIPVQAIGQSIWKNVTFGQNITAYESGTDIMPNKLFEVIFSAIEKITKKSLTPDEEYFRSKAERADLLEQRQVLKFKAFSDRAPAITKLILPMANLCGSVEQIRVADELKNKFGGVFIGAKLLPRKFKGVREKDIDVVILTDNDVVAVEVRAWKCMRRSTLNRRLGSTNVYLRAIRAQYPEITKTICVMANLVVSESRKELFRSNGNQILGINDILNLRFNEERPAQLTLLPTTNQRINLFRANRLRAFKDQEIVHFRNLRRAAGVSLSDICLDLFGTRDKNKNLMAGIETGRNKRPRSLWKIYKESLDSKAVCLDNVAQLIKEENERWELASAFPMVVGLMTNQNNGNSLENAVKQKLIRNGYAVVTNTLVNDAMLSKSISGHHPEADIIGNKEDKYTVVSCKDGRNANRNQFIVSVKREIEKLSQWLEDMEFNEAIVAIAAELGDVPLANLNRYASDNNVRLEVVSC